MPSLTRIPYSYYGYFVDYLTVLVRVVVEIQLIQRGHGSSGGVPLPHVAGEEELEQVQSSAATHLSRRPPPRAVVEESRCSARDDASPRIRRGGRCALVLPPRQRRPPPRQRRRLRGGTTAGGEERGGPMGGSSEVVEVQRRGDHAGGPCSCSRVARLLRASNQRPRGRRELARR